MHACLFGGETAHRQRNPVPAQVGVELDVEVEAESMHPLSGMSSLA
jgi:hypothetical protein